MNSDSIRYIFAAICAGAVVALCAGAIFEWGRFKRGVSPLSTRHFRWRMVSAVLWLVILGAFGYSTLFLWPSNALSLSGAQLSPADLVQMRRFTALVSGAVVLLMVALLIMSFDFYFTLLAQKRLSAQFGRERAQLAREEIERTTKREQQGE